ncbi:hypothetical protein GI584_03770 [Gracilibacillus salitolerans]|uniref:Uncharacterized protein n=1 Tax=Gracilibacillus salitolerans TaxID=2663022 RepID=A0A5Q2TG66_9BACI|nr:hypothetical protein [Gracilibacillus salitolerans]QGH33207.1 hypothetical protein GI584_03770 [Gracilibacillus salitolerans]
MEIIFGIFIWLFMCGSILILASFAIHLEGEEEKRDLKGYLAYIEEVYSRNITDQKK